MIIKNSTLETVCGITSKLPQNHYPEIAFAGKSNVGKSSLINVLMNRKSLARISTKPGKTQTINFYNLNGNLYLVDLPGYGYANVSVEVKEKWGKMIEKYLRTSKCLQLVFLLIDLRHEPSANDKIMYDWIKSNGYSPIIICTKADKLSKSAQLKNVSMIRKELKAGAEATLIAFSAETKQGRDDIYSRIDQMMIEWDENHPNEQ